MYAGYIAKQEDAMPGKPPIGRSLFYTIAKHITGGGKQLQARAGGRLYKSELPQFHHCGQVD